jgi:hypothetical protein
MSINSDELFNLYSINKIIKNDGAINLTDLETLTYLIDFITSHNSTQQATFAKLNDEDLLELININKNKNDTRTFLDKLEINDSSNDSSNCSNNIELIIDDSNAPEASNEPEAEASNEPELEASNEPELEASNEPEAEASNNVITKMKNKTKRKSHKKQKSIERKTKRNK